jgi:hypothetical protein
MDQKHCLDADSSSAVKQIFRLAWTSKFHYRLHKSETLTYRSQTNLVNSPLFDLS